MDRLAEKCKFTSMHDQDIEKDEEASDNESERHVIGKINGKPAVRRVAIELRGAKAVGLKTFKKTVAREKAEDDYVELKINIDKRGAEDDAWKLVQRDPEKALHLW